ncbi:OLC1v1023050C1 [Oldenlandia corymbosa var. corymbosa]|uniref:OLC1v1023050C1 n=1 Tax=Oldenlandia corymbosa var. corymbosa TaxID=529605 RepID=A0AAV1BZ39_OLDCO|nr:OLC1v1023050C1 [Oldenlandia corymbosa var. corymbosa]
MKAFRLTYNGETIYQVTDNNWGDGHQWRRGSLLGKGGFGSVFLGILKNTNSLIAVKSTDIMNSGSIKEERFILSFMVGCPYIIQCYGEETTTDSHGNSIFNLLLEYGSGGNLFNRIHRSENRRMSEELEVRWYTRTILEGLAHIHEVGFVHCDLKPENIILVPWRTTSSGRVEFVAKICDFGLAKRAQKINPRSRKPRPEKGSVWRGTPMYLSPEAVKHGLQEPCSDMWALGCVVLEMLTGERPWKFNKGVGERVILDKIGKTLAVPKLPKKKEISPEARSFLKCCLRRRVEKRMSAKTLLHHPFVAVNGYLE